MEGVEKAWEYVRKSPELYSIGYEKGKGIGEDIEVPKDLMGVLFLGMGGSGIAGDITRDLLMEPFKTPVYVIKDYSIPFKVNDKHLVIAVSYSGTTAETIVAAAQARRQGAKLVFVTSGGVASNIAEKHGIPVVKISQGMQPRFATPEMVGASYGLLASMGLDEERNGSKFTKCIDELREFINRFTSLDSGETTRAAEIISDKPTVIYSHSHLISSGYRFKAQLNENAKHPAFHAALPEAGHNEVESWVTNPKVANVIIRSGWEAPAFRELLNWMVEEIERRNMALYQLRVEAASPMAEILKVIALVDFISVALSRIKGVDPLKLEILPQVRKAVKTNEKLKEHAAEGF